MDGDVIRDTTGGQSKGMGAFLDHARSVIARGVNDDEALTAAHAIWIGYPFLFTHFTLYDRKGNSERYRHYLDLQKVHSDAAKLLVQLAESLKLDGGPIWSAAELCRELFDCHHQFPVRLNHDDFWPWCLGPTRSELSETDRATVVKGSEVMARIEARIKLAESPATFLERVPVGTPKANPSTSATTTSDDEGYKTPPSPESFYKKRHAVEVLMAVGVPESTAYKRLQSFEEPIPSSDIERIKKAEIQRLES